MAVGVVAEFNPFHNGHKYLLNEAKKCTNESIVAIMSGAFVQRGGIAVTDKYTRARAAILNGADLVLELPVIFSHNTAQKFASGAIYTLHATGIINTLAFGSESGQTDSLNTAADILINEPKEVSEKIKSLMADGISYPSAREKAFRGYINTSVLSTPNDILAIEYLRSSKEIGANFKPIAIKRIGADHDSETVRESTASASEIRRRLFVGADTKSFMPGYEFSVYNPELLDNAVLSNLRLISPAQLSAINEVGEGLENKFIKSAKETSSVADLCMAVKSKRYTLSRIRRIAYSALLGITKEIASLQPSYIRVLAMNDNGKSLLKEMKETATLPIIVKPADYKGDTIFNINQRAEDIFALCATDKTKRLGGTDIKTTPFIL
ncbi:MAG: nucleotidyltransferase [Clostridia bacterium]|nr:nucleotidyltransferase [Clostridia bacterium]